MDTPTLPQAGTWFKRANADRKEPTGRYTEHPTDVVCIESVDAEKERITLLRWDGAWDGQTPVFARRTGMNFSSWKSRGRYLTPMEAPTPPAPAPVIAEPPMPSILAHEAPSLAETHAEVVALRQDVARLQKTVDALVGTIATRGLTGATSQLGLPLSTPAQPQKS